MLAAARGDTASFALLADKYRNVLLNHFVRKGVSPNDGEDLVQQTFLRLWRYRKRYAPKARFTTFLFLLAGQVCVDAFRQSARRKRMEDGYESELAVRRDAADSPQSAPGEADDVRRALARLSPPLRDVVEFGVFQSLDYAEVAQILGIPRGTVKSRMFNALRRLREIFDESGRR